MQVTLVAVVLGMKAETEQTPMDEIGVPADPSFTVPATSSLLLGPVVPIPTLPSFLTKKSEFELESVAFKTDAVVPVPLPMISNLELGAVEPIPTEPSA